MKSSKTGTISISDERFLMLRASMFSIDFYKPFSETFAGGVGAKPTDEQVETAVQSILFDFGHVMGVSDCRGFMKRMNIKNGLDAAFAGSSHLAYSGTSLITSNMEDIRITHNISTPYRLGSRRVYTGFQSQRSRLQGAAVSCLFI